ncbi:hypothetical protein GUITHDRAFT_86396 [Guillardia theta CCMP2712]|uniref:GTP-binding protein n=1 Tax=Guillardia theta (strain CCMP2712) TaxID=905079 RepID=L1JGP3_GUITC|nr:hypothetical protein GUITHDRAFT_86396 [Guillardia theta CCMP2712]EKX47497.1 hypothetical protein GUITHDRAFT_86396 [Guillardia theta CCMP2712]|eukprot:XP_005834477.1 hypothetical protein GUITHDRAFT_86396 [Guillardia theta CCMP2712]
MQNQWKKVLLMGKSNAGKTSMRSIIFANYIARETTRLGYTQDVEHSHVRFLGNLVLNLWDCGGQEAYMESYFESQRDHIFRNVAVLIYVFDIESQQMAKDMQYFTLCIDALKTNSENPKVFCLVHKMDLVPEETRDQVFEKQEALIRGVVGSLDTTCFQTSIWDETLYRAWSQIVYSLIPNVAALENHLASFCQGCGADEVVLFERATFLVISHSTQKAFRDVHRFEKISNIIKQFKLSCSKSQAQFNRMQIKNSKFTAIIDAFTPTTCIMVICSDPAALPAMTLVNINNARSYFEKHISMDIGGEASSGKAV